LHAILCNASLLLNKNKRETLHEERQNMNEKDEEI